MTLPLSPMHGRRARRLAVLAPAAALLSLCSGCMWHRTGEPFVATRMGAELAENGLHLGWSDSRTPPGVGHSCGCCFALTGGPAIDLLGLPVDLAIQAFGPARIRVMDERGEPVEGADATVRIYCGAPDDTILHRRTGRDGTFRLRRRVSNENLLGGRVVDVRVDKEGYCPVRAGDFSAFSHSNVVTVTMPHFVPGAGHVVERAADDPDGRFPPWSERNPNDVYIDCKRGRVFLWDPGPVHPGNGDFHIEREWSREDAPPRFGIYVPWNGDAPDGVAVAAFGPNGPDVVPDGADFHRGVKFSAADLSGDEPRKGLFFRVRPASSNDPPHYGRIDFWWEGDYPVGIRRVLYSDAPGERDLRFTAPPPVPVTP